MRHHSSRRTLVAVLLSYLFVTSSLVPFSAATRSAPVKKTARSTQATQNAPYREGELLVRFRSGVSPLDKDTIIARHGAQKKKQLVGNSGVEKLELACGPGSKNCGLGN